MAAMNAGSIPHIEFDVTAHEIRGDHQRTAAKQLRCHRSPNP